MVEWLPEYMRRYTQPETPEEKKEAQYVIRWRGNATRDKAQVMNFVRDVVTGLEPILLKYVVPHDYQPEVRFRAPIRIPYLDGRLTSIDLIGGIDIVTRLNFDVHKVGKEGQWVMYDLKATANADYIPKTLGQSIFYDLGGTAYYGQTPVAFGFIAPAIPEKVVWSRITDDDRRAMMARIIRFAHGNWKKDWSPHVTSQCSMCDVQHACVMFKPVTFVDAQQKNRASFAETAAARAVHRT
jgi:hypothetical protein